MHIIIYLCIFWHESLHSSLLQKYFEYHGRSSSSSSITLLPLHHNRPFSGPHFSFLGQFQGNTGSFGGHKYKEKGHKVQNYYILLFLKKELLSSTLLSGFKFGWSIAVILYIGRKHEFQIAHIPIWTSVSDVDMKSCTGARVTYPPSSLVPHRGEWV